jgi:hypothetical protein
MRRSNRYLDAFKEQFNVIGLSTAAALSAATLNPLPLLVGLAAEAAYLLFVPDSRWYMSRLAKRYDAEIERRRQQLKEETLPLLRPEMQARFGRLEEIHNQILAQPVEGQTWFREVLRKLDYLLEKFLLFARKEAQFRSYLQSLLEEVRGVQRRSGIEGVGSGPGYPDRARGRIPVTREPARPTPASADHGLPRDRDERWVQQAIREVQAQYEAEMDELQRLHESEQDVGTKSVLEKRLDVLQRRHEYCGKIGKILSNLNHQLQLLEDTFGLINDEIRARSPEQILSDIEEVVWQTDTMTKVLDEVAPLEQMVARMSG